MLERLTPTHLPESSRKAACAVHHASAACVISAMISARNCHPAQVLRSYTYVVLWMSISISVILFNKWLLAFSGFPYPIALTSWHMLFCSTIGFLCVRVFKVVKSHNMTAHTYTRRVLPIGEGDDWHRPA